MRKIVLSVILLNLLVSGASAQISINTTSEWNTAEASSSDIRAVGDRLRLIETGISLNWSSDSFSGKIDDLALDQSYIYAVTPDNVYKINDEDGSEVWSVTATGTFYGVHKAGDGYLYAGLNSSVVRIDPTNGNIESTGGFPFTMPNNNVRAFESEPGYIYASTGYQRSGKDGTVYKIDLSDGSMEWESDLDSATMAMKIHPDTGDLYVGGVNQLYRVNENDGSVIDQTGTNIDLSIDALAVGPDNYVWVADGNDKSSAGSVEKFTQDLGTNLCSDNDYAYEVNGLVADKSGVYASSPFQGGGEPYKFKKYDENCNPVWEKNTRGYIALEGRENEIFAGGRPNHLDQYTRDYESDGSFESTDYTWGSNKYMDEARINVSLNGEAVNFSLEQSEVPGFAPPKTRKDEYVLKDGLNTVNLPVKITKGARFIFESLSGSNKATPEIHWIEINYASSPVGGKPVIQDPQPTDGGAGSYDPTSISVNVTDPDGDVINVTFKEKGGNIIEKITNVNSGERVSSIYTGMVTGNTYTWWVNATDDTYEVNDSFSFTYEKIKNLHIKTRFKTNYTSLLTSTSEQAIVPYKLRTESGTREVKLSIASTDPGITADFLDGVGKRSFNIDSTGRTVLIKLNSSSTGRKEVTIGVEDLTLGVRKEDKLEVMVRDTPASFEANNVPGIGILHLLAILFTSSLAYSALL